MIVVLFRWEIDPAHEKIFKEGWTELVQRNIEKYGALGSRLHKTKDNQWVSYSQWISEEHYQKAQNLEDKHEEARSKMLTAIISTATPLILVPMLDHLIGTNIPTINKTV
ncbi:antibiotic biosynthesis monooxygenase family protein [Psychromonas aquatilis]|uniref:Antibiotic biosynthesis monooxygenase n=1 Tax=Psychromonas aquatilis TaxID=2005072 RepID=A0ABU9GT33_9GAMM